jgi:diguanylate cyclase (GGDEF)-like protein
LTQPARTSAPGKQLAEIDRRNWHLWVLTLFISVSLSLAIAAIFYPAIRWGVDRIEAQYGIMPQLICGLITLILLSSVYVLTKQHELNEMRNFIVGNLGEAGPSSSNPFSEDVLTGVLDRRALPDILDLETRRADRYRSALCMVLFDIRGFRQFNEKEGNLSGDVMLKDVARTLKSTVRRTDVVVRYGPDEFLCLLPATAREGGEIFAHRVTDACEKVDRLRAFTLDYGVSLYRMGEDSDLMLANAEQELAKKKTINENEISAMLECVKCHSREMAQLTADQYRKIITHSPLARSCLNCGVTTDWALVFLNGGQSEGSLPR